MQTQHCQEIALPFLCQFYFPLHDCPNGDIYTASREDCIDISTGICALQWNLAINYGFEKSLPNCHELPSGIYMRIIQYNLLHFILYSSKYV